MDLNDLEQKRSFQKKCGQCDKWCMVRTVAPGDEGGSYEYECPKGHRLGYTDDIVEVSWKD